MLKSVYYFVDEKGNMPVKEFIDSLSLKERAKVFAYIGELENQGHNLRRPMADYLGDGIYELRPKKNRLFYFFFLRDSTVLVHAIKKKTKKVPKADLALSKKRKAQIEMGSKIEKVEPGGD